jgi:hypothetical protein
MAGPERRHYAGELRVGESAMFFGGSSDGPTVYVVGLIENPTQVTWHNVDVEARFRDVGGELIDAAVDRYVGTVPAGGEMAFRVGTTMQRPRELYDSYEVAVRWAEGR